MALNSTLRQRTMGRAGQASMYGPQQDPTVNSGGYSASATIGGNVGGGGSPVAVVGILLVLLLIGHYYWTRSVQGGR